MKTYLMKIRILDRGVPEFSPMSEKPAMAPPSMYDFTMTFPKYRQLFLAPVALVALLLGFAQPLWSSPPREWQGPLPAITTGYGSWGTHGVSAPATFEITSSGFTNSVTLYFPGDQTEAAPGLFFAPGWDVSCEGYGELLRFMASKGYVTICDDYGENSGVIGDQLFDAFTEAADRYPALIDTSRIGLIGHSAGAGLLGSLGYRLSIGEGWGANGRFIFSSAPWIDFDITSTMLENYPTDMKLILQTYEDDLGTDLRTYIDLFESQTRIPDTEKDYLIVRPSTIEGYDYSAVHSVIGTGGDGYGVFDALDSWAVFRPIDALAVYAFTGSDEAKSVALGDGGDEQIEMGELRDLISTDDPRPIPGQDSDYPCDIPGNPRHDHCADYDLELPGAVLILPTKSILIFQPSPSFEWEPIPTATHYFLQLRPLLPGGEPDWTTSYGESMTSINAACAGSVQDCTWTIGATLPQSRYVWWIKGFSDTLESVWSRRGFFSDGGDVNLDGEIDGTDMDALLSHIFGNPQPHPDVNGDQAVDSLDVFDLAELLTR
jgi:hypothetical protein